MIIFLLGIPGCGKSELYRRLMKKLQENNLFEKFPRVDDFPKLWAIVKEDERTGLWKRCRQSEAGGFKITDDTVWDDILKEVNKDVMEMIKSDLSDTLLFIEFSRPNYVHSILNNFSKEILNQSMAIYIDVSFETCWERNVRRHEKAVAQGTDDHLVSREEMEKTYGSDDKDVLDEKLPMHVVFVENEEDDLEKLDEKIEKVSVVIENKKQLCK